MFQLAQVDWDPPVTGHVNCQPKMDPVVLAGVRIPILRYCFITTIIYRVYIFPIPQ